MGEAFIRMYRPHRAREETVLFPALHDVLSFRQLDLLGDAFEEQEDKLLGPHGFEIGSGTRSLDAEKRHKLPPVDRRGRIVETIGRDDRAS